MRDGSRAAARIRAVLLDAGGTLFHERPSRAAIYAAVARREGVSIGAPDMHRVMVWAHQRLPQRVRGHFRYTDPWFVEYIRVVFRRVGVRGDLARVRERLFRDFARPSTFRLYPEVEETLRALRRRRLVLGIVSNWSPRLGMIVRGLGIDRMVRFALASASLRIEKPDPRIFRRAVRLAGVPADEVLHVGDNESNDVEGARAAGIRAVLLRRGRGAVRGGTRAVIPSLDRLLPLLRDGATS